MSSVKGQFKWVVKYFSSIVLVLLVAYAAVAYFTTKVSVTNFTTAAFVVVVTVLLVAYYGLMNIRSALTFALIAIVLLAGVVCGDRPKPNGGLFQSVTLTTGQTYYGHLTNINTANATLTDVYTLQTTQQPTTTNGKTTTATKPVLVNLSKVLPDPENKITIRTDKILFWANLQSSSKVTQAINKDLQK